MRLRLATFNAALSRACAGGLLSELRAGSSQARAVAAIIRHCRPDVVLLSELDHDPYGAALASFHDGYLASGDAHGTRPIDYPHRFAAAVNTGVPSGFDLIGEGRPDDPRNALGFGAFPGQYGMALLSRYPVDPAAVRTFRDFPWQRLPGAVLPARADAGPWFPQALLPTLPLSSKSHWDVPVTVGAHTVHCLAAHPTPPVFDGPERRNRHRNRDELLFWAHYLDDHPALVDDAGRAGGLPADELAVVLGDLNADPHDGEADRDGINALLGHPRLSDARPRSEGAREWHRRQVQPSSGDPALMTGWFGCFGLRLDYVLADRRLRVPASGVFWPPAASRRAAWVGTPARPNASDHRLVWLDVTLPD